MTAITDSTGRGRIAVFRALQLGDLLCAGPAWKALRTACPLAQLTFIGLPWTEDLSKRLGFDRFLSFPGYPGLPEQPLDATAFPRFLEAMQAEAFDLVLQMHGNGIVSNPLVSLFGAKRLGGYYTPGQYCPDKATFLTYPAHLPEIWRHLALLRHLGVPAVDDRLSLALNDSDHTALDALLAEHHIRTPYICIHPGARAEWRCWEPRHYAAVGDALSQRGWHIVLTGSRSERALAGSVMEMMTCPATNLAGETSQIGVLGALIAKASLMICGDTGLSHLATAVDTPSVIIFMRSDQEGWPPLDRVRHRVVCHPKEVTPEHALREALSLLSSAPSLSRL